MNRRLALIGGLVLLLGIGLGAWTFGRPAYLWIFPGAAPEAAAADPAPDPDDENLPVPPVPPRIAEGAQYEHCLDMLANDPAGASAYAESWQAAGGRDGAIHCLALSHVTLGEATTGAEMLEALARDSRGPGISRGAVYAQAAQAWMIAGEPARAVAAGTLALALSPDDPDLLVDRAFAAAALGQYRDAADDLTHALDLDPKRADAMTLRGTAWRHLGQLDLAQDDIDRALALDSDNAETLLEQGILQQRRNDLAGARRSWERAIALAPDSPAADFAQQNLSLLEAGPARR